MTAETLKPFLTVNGPMENLATSGTLKATNATQMSLIVGKANADPAERSRVYHNTHHHRLRIVFISLTVFVLSVLMLSALIWHNVRLKRLETEVASLNRLLDNLQKRLGIFDLTADLDADDAEENAEIPINNFENEYNNVMKDLMSQYDYEDYVQRNSRIQQHHKHAKGEKHSGEQSKRFPLEDDNDDYKTYEELTKDFLHSLELENDNSDEEEDEDDDDEDEDEDEEENTDSDEEEEEEEEEVEKKRNENDPTYPITGNYYVPKSLVMQRRTKRLAASRDLSNPESESKFDEKKLPIEEIEPIVLRRRHGTTTILRSPKPFVGSHLYERRHTPMHRYKGSGSSRRKILTVRSAKNDHDHHHHVTSSSSTLEKHSVSRPTNILSKPAAHFHLHRKLSDAHTSVKVNMYVGDVYVGHPSWTSDVDTSNYFQVENGKLIIRQTGMYYVYAQICYNNTHDHNGYVIFHGHKPFLQCLITVPTNVSLKIHTCHTSGLIYLQANEHLHLRDFHRERSAILKDSNNRSYFGIIKI